MKAYSSLGKIDPSALGASSPYILRTLDVSHIRQMLTLQERGGDGNIAKQTEADYNRHFREGQKAIGMIAADGTLAAHALIDICRQETLIRNVVTDPAHRGHKLMPKLVAHWLKAAAQQNCTIAEAWVRPQAKTSLGIFLEAGLEITRTMISPKSGEMVQVLQKPLGELQPGAIDCRRGFQAPSA